MKVDLTSLFENIEKTKEVQKGGNLLGGFPNDNSGQMLRYDEIIRGVSGKYGKDWCLTFDEVYSELCYKILKLGVDAGWENLNEKMVAKICYNKAVDVFRAAKRRWGRTMTEAAILAEGNNEATHSKHGNPEDSETKILYIQFLESYHKESRERKYLTIKMVSEQLLPPKYAEELGIEIPHYEMRDWEISEMLGLHPRSKSFQRMKNRLEEEMKDFLEMRNRD